MAPLTKGEDDRTMRAASVGLCVIIILISAPAPSLSNQTQTFHSNQTQTSIPHQPQTFLTHESATSLTHESATSLDHESTTSLDHESATSLTQESATFPTHESATFPTHESATYLTHQPLTSHRAPAMVSTHATVSAHPSLGSLLAGQSTAAAFSVGSTLTLPDQSTMQLMDFTGTIVGIGGLKPDEDKKIGRLDENGISRIKQYFDRARCLADQFPCMSGECINVSQLDDGRADCLTGDDEPMVILDSEGPFICVDPMYKCESEPICVLPPFMCDGLVDCPYGDDEGAACNNPCPAGACWCGRERWFEPFYRCNATFPLHDQFNLRGLHMSPTPGLAAFLAQLHEVPFLRFLNVSHCALTQLTLRDLHTLAYLDASYNRLTHLRDVSFRRLRGLVWLDLSNNRMLTALDSSFAAFLRLIDAYGLDTLYLEHTGITSIGDRVLENHPYLRDLDVSDNAIEHIGREALWGLSKLAFVFADDARLCCPYFVRGEGGEGDHPVKCNSPEDELSSCEDLLRSESLRVFVWLFSSLALVGNAAVLLHLWRWDTRVWAPGPRVLLKSLCLADLLMGVYLAVIGAADALFRGEYVGRAPAWRRSQVCWAAGVLSLVSSEVSALVIGAVTLDRVLVLCCPLRASLHLTARSALALSVALWLLGALLAAVPLLAGLEFYDQTGLCLPLPISSRTFSGQGYAFAIFIVLNMLIFLAILGGQLAIFVAVRVAGSASGTGGEQRRAQEANIARRLLLVVLSDFCCWFPVCLLGLLAKGGVPISESISIWAAIFVLPLNSALNPLLYTLNAIMDEREKRRLEMRVRKMFRRLKVEIPKMEASKVEEVVRVCIQCKSVKRDRLARLLGLEPVTYPHLEGSQTEDGPPSHGLEPVTHPHLEGSQTEDGPPSHGLEPVTHPHLEGSQTEDGPPSHGLEPVTHPHLEGSQTEDGPPSHGLEPVTHPHLEGSQTEDGPPSHGLPEDGYPSQGLGDDGPPSRGLPTASLWDKVTLDIVVQEG